MGSFIFAVKVVTSAEAKSVSPVDSGAAMSTYKRLGPNNSH